MIECTKHQENNSNRDLTIFFAITFIFSWLIWLPSVLVSQGVIVLPDWVGLVTNIATFGPAVGAITVIGFKSGKTGLKELLSKLIRVGFDRKWWIIIFLLIPVITGISYVIAVPLSGDTWDTGFMWSTLINVFIMFFIGGPLGEELGWRGYALESLQKKKSALMSSLILGLIWGVWHLPLHFMKGSTQWYIPIWAFILLQLVISILYTWIYNNTKSVLAVMIFHWMGNAAAMLLPFWQKGFLALPFFPNYAVSSPSLLEVFSINNGVIFTHPNLWIPSVGMLVVFVLNLIVAVIVLSIWGPKKLRRKKELISKIE